MRIYKGKAISIFKNMKDLFHRISTELSKVKPFSKGKTPVLSEKTKKMPF